MTNPTLAPQSDEYQQIHDGIIRLVDTARTETVRSTDESPNDFYQNH